MMKQVYLSRLHLLVVSADTPQNSGCNAGVKLRPTNEELSSISPEFDHRWSTHFENEINLLWCYCRTWCVYSISNHFLGLNLN